MHFGACEHMAASEGMSLLDSTHDCAPPGRNDLQSGFDVSQVSSAAADEGHLSKSRFAVSHSSTIKLWMNGAQQVNGYVMIGPPVFLSDGLTYLSRLEHNDAWSKPPSARPSTFRGICTAGCTRQPRARVAPRAS